MDQNLTGIVSVSDIPEVKTEMRAKRLVFLCKSDLRGGAAIVTFRLVETMRRLGHDARMLVCEKLSDVPFVEVCAPKIKIKASFLKERLKVYMHNGRNRETLFKIDPASDGLNLWHHPLVKNADAIFLSWVNQGMLSLKGVRRICGSGKPVVWIMHDMWNMTGVCHHAGNCTGFLHQCGDCPLLGIKASPADLSNNTWRNKEFTYGSADLKFVAVSTWLAAKAKESALMRNMEVEVIPNAFDIGPDADEVLSDLTATSLPADEPVKIIFGGARLDDPIKGLPVLKKALSYIRSHHPAIAEDMQLVTFGEFKLPESNAGFDISHTHLGMLQGNVAVRRAYEGCGIVVSTSDYETLPGTLIEGQAYGCIPVATNHGGQRDIIDHKITGFLVPWHDSPSIRAEEVARGLLWAYHSCRGPMYAQIRQAMRESVIRRFSAPAIARRLLGLIGD